MDKPDYTEKRLNGSLSKYDLRTLHPYPDLYVVFGEDVRRRSLAKHPERSEWAKGEGRVGWGRSPAVLGGVRIISTHYSRSAAHGFSKSQ